MRNKIIPAVDTASFHLLPRSIWTAQSVKVCGLGGTRKAVGNKSAGKASSRDASSYYRNDALRRSAASDKETYSKEQNLKAPKALPHCVKI